MPTVLMSGLFIIINVLKSQELVPCSTGVGIRRLRWSSNYNQYYERCCEGESVGIWKDHQRRLASTWEPIITASRRFPTDDTSIENHSGPSSQFSTMLVVNLGGSLRYSV